MITIFSKYKPSLLSTLYSLLLTSALALTTSCNSWFDVEPTTETDRGVLFKTEAGFADAMSGIYSNMCDEDLYGKNLTWFALDIMGSATFSWGSAGDVGIYSWNPKSINYYESARNKYCDPIWNKQYNTIANINSLLSQIDECQGVFQGNDYNVFKGEALGLRAFLHFDLMRLFTPAYAHGGTDEALIPYVSEISSNVNALLTSDQLCILILDDLSKAKELLKSDPMYLNSTPTDYTASTVTGNATYRERYNIKSWHNRRFHFNYYAVIATMARVYLWKGDKANALACAKEVIDAQNKAVFWVNSSLVSNIPSSSQYASRDRTFSTEQLFALNILNMEDRTDGYLWEGENEFSGMNGCVVGFDATCFDASEASYDSRLTYLSTSYSLYGTEFKLTTKFRKDNDYNNSYSPWSANRLPLIRASEMYYIAAECESDLATATQYLEQVRIHRGLQSVPLSVSSKEDLQNEIEREYKKEFIGEGQYFYYLKRMDKPHAANGMYNRDLISTDLYTMVRPDEENTYGNRPKQ